MTEWYSSKYALTCGVEQLDPAQWKLTDSGDYLMGKHCALLKVGRDVFASELDAIAVAEQMCLKKVASLQKQIAKLDKIRFER